LQNEKKQTVTSLNSLTPDHNCFMNLRIASRGHNTVANEANQSNRTSIPTQTFELISTGN